MTVLFGFSSSFAADFNHAVQLFNQKKYKQASVEFQQVCRQNPNNPTAIYYLGASLQNAGNVEQASKFYNHLLKTHPRSRAAQYAQKALASLAKSGHSRSSSSRTSQGSTSRNSDYIPDSETIPFRLNEHKHLMVNCQINGRPIPMIFDTGATNNIIGKNHLQRLGIRPPSGNPTNQLKGSGGIEPVWEMPATISLGKIKRNSDLVIVKHMKSPPLLGQSFFGDLQYTIDNSSGSIRFSSPNSRQASVPHDTINIPFQSHNNNIIVTAKVNGKPMRFYFDTGAQATSVTEQAMLKNGKHGWTQAGVKRGAGVGGNYMVMQYRVNSIELGPLRKSGLVVGVNNKLPLGLLGQDFFGRRRFTIDRQNKVIRFHR